MAQVSGVGRDVRILGYESGDGTGTTRMERDGVVVGASRGDNDGSGTSLFRRRLNVRERTAQRRGQLRALACNLRRRSCFQTELLHCLGHFGGGPAGRVLGGGPIRSGRRGVRSCLSGPTRTGAAERGEDATGNAGAGRREAVAGSRSRGVISRGRGISRARNRDFGQRGRNGVRVGDIRLAMTRAGNGCSQINAFPGVMRGGKRTFAG